MKLIFEASESFILKRKPYWIRIGFWRWLWMKFDYVDGGYVLRERWVKNPPNKGEKTERSLLNDCL